jgi:EAL domain-containing protein (putative c-di-GMP-specific phosphodiesterase class I)
VHHYEALTRFEHASSTFETIRLAEELDLIEAFDLAVVEKVVKTLQSEPIDVRIAVNVSGRSFLRPNFIDRVLDLTAKGSRLKDRLLFEITESAALADLDAANERVQRLRASGYRVCVDDFGSGAASLAYISRLTVDIVKLDGGLLREIVSGGRDEVLLRHLAALCRDLKVQTIAEMIETEAAAGIVKGLGVDLGQGYLFGAGRETITVREPPKPVARRKGVVQGWG